MLAIRRRGRWPTPTHLKKVEEKKVTRSNFKNAANEPKKTTVMTLSIGAIDMDKLVNDNGALVLGRRVGQTVMIGDDIEITLTQVHGNQIKLMFNAPRKTQIHRKEVYDKIKRDKLIAQHGDDFGNR